MDHGRGYPHCTDVLICFLHLSRFSLSIICPQKLTLTTLFTVTTILAPQGCLLVYIFVLWVPMVPYPLLSTLHGDNQFRYFFLSFFYNLLEVSGCILFILLPQTLAQSLTYKQSVSVKEMSRRHLLFSCLIIFRQQFQIVADEENTHMNAHYSSNNVGVGEA